MEFHEKLQELRRRKDLTQEELAARLFVSRTAVSKWESGRGYPSIDSLQAIAAFFSVTIDELLSGRELLCIAETDSLEKTRRGRAKVFGLLDCAAGMLLFLPLFGQREGDFIRQVSLLSLSDAPLFLKGAYLLLVLLTAAWGVATLALQNCGNAVWTANQSRLSVIWSILGVLIFMAGLEAYAAFFAFSFLIIKGVLLLKRP